MVRFIFGIIVVLVGGGLLVAGKASLDGDSFSLRPVGAILALVGLLFVGWSTIKTVPANSVGIPVAFGHVGADLQPGVHMLSPWTTVTSLTTREQVYSMVHNAGEGSNGDDSITVLSSDGGSMGVDSTIQYRIDPAHANNLYHTLGSIDRLNTVIARPAARAAILQVFSQYNAVDAYSTDRPKLGPEIDALLRPQLAAHGVILDSVQIRGIVLSQQLQDSANNKLAAEQRAQAAQYALQQAKIDAQTAVAAAKGKAEANRTLQQSLNAKILCEKFIENMSSLQVPVGSPCGPNAGQYLIDARASGK